MTHYLRPTNDELNSIGQSGEVQGKKSYGGTASQIVVFGVIGGNSSQGSEVLRNFYGQQVFGLEMNSRTLLVRNLKREVSI